MSERQELLVAVMEGTIFSNHPWYIACDANMNPRDFEKDTGLKARTCSSKHSRKKFQRADQEAQKVS